MNGLRLSSADQLITHLRMTSEYPHAIGPMQPAPYIDQDVFLMKFARYLRGQGHPVHPNLPEDAISNADRAAARGKAAFRAEQFLILATGSEILPDPDESWAINVSILVESSCLCSCNSWTSCKSTIPMLVKPDMSSLLAHLRIGRCDRPRTQIAMIS